MISGCTTGINDGNRIVVREASDIARVNNKLFIVGDDADGRYFELRLEDQTGSIIPIDSEKVRAVFLPQAELAMDLEGIDNMADGRIAILSEQLHCLIAEKMPGLHTHGVIAEYDKTLIEFGNRGLEGLAIKRLSNGTSRIAVLWEGGYPIYKMVPKQLREHVGRLPLKPVIIVHEIERGQVAGIVDKPLHSIMLNVPEPEGEPPLAQRFRATDLVWYDWPDEGKKEDSKEGFIVLMSSENAPPESTGSPTEYRVKILQRFSLDGNPRGEPLFINEVCKQYLRDFVINKPAFVSHEILAHIKEVATLLDEGNWENINWEGLDWFEEGRSLIAIYDKWPMDPPFALVIDIPEEWK